MVPFKDITEWLKKYLVYHQYTIITNLYLKLRRKCEVFSSYFARQCPLFVNNSQLPTRFTTHSESVLTSVDFFVEQVINIIKKQDPRKAHGHDKISIAMLKVCGDSINKSIANIFKNFYERIFPNDWKKADVVPIHKKT